MPRQHGSVDDRSGTQGQAPPRPRTSYLEESQCQSLDRAARRVLTQKGWRVECGRLRRELEERGFVHREQEELVLPTEDILDRYFADLRAQRFRRDSMRFHTGGYPTHFIDHRDGEMKPHTQASVLELMAVGERLPVVDGVSAPGTMFDVPLHARPFHTKVLVWTYGEKTTGSFEFTRVDEYPLLKELSRRYADIKGQDIGAVLSGNAFREHALVFGRDKCDFFYRFRDDGFGFRFSNALPVMGLQAPATISGAILASLIDGITTGLFHYVYDGDVGLALATPTVLDMSTSMPRKGVPESLKLLLGLSSMADYYGASVLGNQAFRSQAKSVMSYQNGAERIGHLIAACMCGVTSFNAMGHLSEPDSISSLPQLVLDAEMAAQMRYLLRGFEIDADRMAMPQLLDDPYRMTFVAEPHTVEHMRDEMHLGGLFVGAERYDAVSQAAEDEYERACREADRLLEEPLPRRLTCDEEAYLMEVAHQAERELA